MADDELTAAIAEKRAELIAAAGDAANATLTDMLFRCGVATGVAHSFMAALDAVLEMHAPTAIVRYAEPCPAHLLSISSRIGCPDCKTVIRPGCQRCRDEYGNPAEPEDCKERNAILAALTGGKPDAR